MMLVDTGPLVALFDPQDQWHQHCRATLKEIREPLFTTACVLNEAFYLLGPSSTGSARLRDFVQQGGLRVWFLDQDWLIRTFELMEVYANLPMDLADASLIAAAESLDIRKVFTLDLREFETYRVRRGHRHYPMQIIR